MRIVTYGGAVSLDGFLADANGRIDWLHFSTDVQQVTEDYWKSVDTILMGRKTYAASAAQRTEGRVKSSEKNKRSTYVFSRTLKEIADPDTKLVSDDAVKFVRDLKMESGGGICLMGGGELAQSLLAAGLVERVGVNIHPILLGSGIPIFRDTGKRLNLKLTECRPLDGGCILAQYDVVYRY